MTRTLGLLLTVLMGLGSLNAFAAPHPESSDVSVSSEAVQYTRHLNTYFQDLNVQIKDKDATSSEVISDLEALENFLHGDQSVEGPLKRIVCNKCVCTGC